MNVMMVLKLSYNRVKMVVMIIVVWISFLCMLPNLIPAAYWLAAQLSCISDEYKRRVGEILERHAES